jgi:magnesium chelatase family protein
VVTRYQKRLSGPLLDRIDMHIQVQRVTIDELADAEPGERSTAVRERVTAARQRQWRRFGEHPGVASNAEMRAADIRAICPLDAAGARLLRAAVERFGLSARAYHRVLRVSRTIADLDSANEITETHVAEAVQYQPRSVHSPTWSTA